MRKLPELLASDVTYVGKAEECLAWLPTLSDDDLARPHIIATAQVFATLAVADALVSGGGCSVGDALHPVSR